VHGLCTELRRSLAMVCNFLMPGERFELSCLAARDFKNVADANGDDSA
jgi:hypothetical protein